MGGVYLSFPYMLAAKYYLWGLKIYHYINDMFGSWVPKLVLCIQVKVATLISSFLQFKLIILIYKILIIKQTQQF
jgi:hypothetical protein